MCLADYFIQNRKKLLYEWIGIAHVHHGLRKTADRDAEFVRRFASERNIPFYIRHLDGKLLVQNGSVEENARIARYRALFDVARLPEVRAEEILTAHHANDQAETVLMRLMRGTGLKGLRGILPHRGDGISRPFLGISKAELLRYAESRKLEWVEDETNADESFLRNSVRNSLIPNLFPDADRAVKQLGRIAVLSERVYAKILAEAERAFAPFTVPPRLWPFPAATSPYKNVLALHESVFQRLEAGSKAGASAVLRLWLDAKGFSFPIGTDFKANVSFRDRSLLFEKSRHILWFCKGLRSDVRHNLYFFKENSTPGEWRFRKDGDIYVPAFGKSRSLKKWFEENGVPLFARDSMPLLAQGSRILDIGGIPPLDKGNL